VRAKKKNVLSTSLQLPRLQNSERTHPPPQVAMLWPEASSRRPLSCSPPSPCSPTSRPSRSDHRPLPALQALMPLVTLLLLLALAFAFARVALQQSFRIRRPELLPAMPRRLPRPRTPLTHRSSPLVEAPPCKLSPRRSSQRRPDRNGYPGPRAYPPASPAARRRISVGTPPVLQWDTPLRALAPKVPFPWHAYQKTTGSRSSCGKRVFSQLKWYPHILSSVDSMDESYGA
jgi:hypothetical protein